MNTPSPCPANREDLFAVPWGMPAALCAWALFQFGSRILGPFLAGMPFYYALFACQLAAIVAVFAGFRLRRVRFDLRQLGFGQPMSPGSWGWMAAGIAVVVIRNAVVSRMMPVAAPNVQGVSVWFALLTSVLFIPLCEEAVFRGAILPVLISRRGAFEGLLLSALVFTAIHWPATLTAGIVYFIPGLVFSLQYFYTRNLMVSAVTHMVTNTLPFLLLMR